MKIARYALAALALIAFLTPTAKADSFVYQVTTIASAFNLDMVFDLPSFQETVTTTTFTTATSSLGPITDFALSGNSTSCSVPGTTLSPGPCFIALVPTTTIFNSSPGFTSPRTFTDGVTTVTITEVPSAVPEPSSLALIPLGLVVLLVMRKIE